MNVRLPIHLAVYWLGVAEPSSDGVRMRSAFGPYVECLAESVDRVTVVAHDPPPRARLAEDLADYVTHAPNVDVLSLGPKGSWRAYWARRRRVTSIVGPASRHWDVLLLRFGRRAHLVFQASRCPRTATLVWGPTATRGLSWSRFRRGPLRTALELRSAWHLRRILRGSGLAASDGEDCVTRYGQLPGQMELIRSSSRRREFSFRVEDRLLGEQARFLFVGQLTAAKGVVETVEVFAYIRRAVLPRATLDIVGMGPELERAKATSRREGIDQAVTFRGWIPSGEELFRLYRESDVLLFLSRSTTESMPRVVTEAMAHSVLVVATPVGSLPIAFEHGRDIIFVPLASSASDVSSTVRILAQDVELRRKLIRNAYERAKEASLEHATDLLLTAIASRWPELGAQAQRPEPTKSLGLGDR